MSSNEAYLDDLLKAMSQREEDAQNGIFPQEEAPAEQLAKSEPEALPEELDVEPVTAMEADDLFAGLEAEELRVEPGAEEPFAEPGEEELLTEPELGLGAEELFAEPEMDLGTEELPTESENGLGEKELFTEPDMGLGAEELFTESEAEPGEGELSIEPETGLQTEEVFAEPETLPTEPEAEPDAEVQKEEPGHGELTEEGDNMQNSKPSTDEVKNMTEEEILQLLQLSAGEEEDQTGSDAEKDKDIADDDLDKLLKDMESEDGSLTEINDLLQKAENNQLVDREGGESGAPLEQEAENNKSGGKKKEKSPKPKKEKKGLFARKKKKTAEEEAPADSEAGQTAEDAPQNGSELEDIFSFGADGEVDGSESGNLTDNGKTGEKKEGDQKEKTKKPGFFSKIMNFLLEEDEESDAEGEKDEADQLKTTTDENQEVLKQLKKEDQEGKKKKKKKGKGKAAAEEDEENDEEGGEEPVKKKKKVKKEKEEKAPEPVDNTPQPKLSKKKVRSIALFAFTIMAAILVCCLFIPELSQLSDARSAFYDGDYETCFRTLYGKRLSESDQRMFEQSQMMLSINRSLEAYENYVAVGDELHALDILLQAVQKQDKLLSEAEKYGLAAEAEAAYQSVLTTLAEKYQLTEADAIEINAYEQDAVYTLRVKAIVEGTEFVLPAYLQEGSDANTAPAEGEQEEIVEDVLSVEEELPDTEYEEGILEP